MTVAPISVREDTREALEKLREDREYETFDTIIRRALERTYPGCYLT